MVNGIKCTDMCSLKTCDNRPPEGVADDEEDEIDIDENEGLIFKKMSVMENRNRKVKDISA